MCNLCGLFQVTYKLKAVKHMTLPVISCDLPWPLTMSALPTYVWEFTHIWLPRVFVHGFSPFLLKILLYLFIVCLCVCAHTYIWGRAQICHRAYVWRYDNLGSWFSPSMQISGIKLRPSRCRETLFPDEPSCWVSDSYCYSVIQRQPIIPVSFVKLLV